MSRAAIDPAILEEAADWLMRLNTGAATAADRAACERWRQRSAEHGRAWARAERLLNKLGGLPAPLAMSALDRPRDAGRRDALVKLLGLAAAAPVAWLAWRVADDSRWRADHRTGVGEQRPLQLADGTRLLLNTATAVDIVFDRNQRLIRLHDGEILIDTAPDTRAMPRRFFVSTPHGRLEALGTRFSVRTDAAQTRIAVQQGAVRVVPTRSDTARVLQAGRKSAFDARAVAAATGIDTGDLAWVRGMLQADNMRLADFAAELARYRSGVVRCDPALAELKISGAYPITDTGRTLDMLAATYPIRVRQRWGGYWVALTPVELTRE